MKLSVASVAALSLAGGAYAFFPNTEQNPLIASSKSSSALSPSIAQIQEQLSALGGEHTAEAITAWNRIAELYPEDTISAVQALLNKSKPKSGVKKIPDNKWDYVVEGNDVVSALGSKIGGHEKLKGTKLRIKKPNGLGIDKDIKQYSGYLDVDDDDKHFFFCKYHFPRTSTEQSLTSIIQGSLSLAMTPRTTP
jgi:cathepsin A (carboxypeptidase C)